jgi:hypothetical protein
MNAVVVVLAFSVDVESDAVVLVTIWSRFLVKIITNVIAMATAITIVKTIPKIIRFNMVLVKTRRLK